MKRFVDKIKKNYDVYNCKIIAGVCITLILVVILFIIKSIFYDKKNDEISFKNDALQNAVEEAIGSSSITDVDLQETEVLDLSNMYIGNQLEELKKFECLKELYVSNCGIESLDDLNLTSELKVLDCSDNEIRDISVLNDKEEFYKLEKLILNENPIENDDISSLVEMRNLKELSVTKCKLTDEIELKKMENLEMLDVSDNSIESINGNIPKLRILYINNNNFNTINSLLKYASLQELYIYNNCLGSIDSIEQLFGLEVLDIRCNDIKTIKGIEKLNSLNSIYLDKDIDRKELNFLFDNKWKDGDIYTKQYFLKKRYNLS